MYRSHYKRPTIPNFQELIGEIKNDGSIEMKPFQTNLPNSSNSSNSSNKIKCSGEEQTILNTLICLRQKNAIKEFLTQVLHCVNMNPNDTMHPLVLASMHNDPSLMKTLMKFGAESKSLDQDSLKDIKVYAKFYGNEKIIKVLSE